MVDVGSMKQGDSIWGGKKLDCSAWEYLLKKCPAPTIKQKGCLMTSLANVTEKTPDVVNEELGGMVNIKGGLDPKSLSDAAEKLGYAYAKQVSLSETEIMTNGLCKGNPVLARVISAASPEHWVAITGQLTDAATGECSDYSISDPAKDGKGRLSDYSAKVTGIFMLVKGGGSQ